MDSAEAAHRRFIAKVFRTLLVTARSCWYRARWHRERRRNCTL